VEVTSSVAATVVRSVADIPGWKASGDHEGQIRTIALRRDGLVQSFSVPKGTTLVTFSYEAPGLRTGLGLCALGLLVMLLFGLVTCQLEALMFSVTAEQ
jgi:uncharacterized membrane protein YfhO